MAPPQQSVAQQPTMNYLPSAPSMVAVPSQMIGAGTAMMPPPVQQTAPSHTASSATSPGSTHAVAPAAAHAGTTAVTPVGTKKSKAVAKKKKKGCC
jgi:hypothetical protein